MPRKSKVEVVSTPTPTQPEGPVLLPLPFAEDTTNPVEDLANYEVKLKNAARKAHFARMQKGGGSTWEHPLRKKQRLAAEYKAKMAEAAASAPAPKKTRKPKSI